MVETIKKFGAGLIIIILVAMMALVFSNQPIDEVTRILSGNPGAGKFQSQVIDLQIYSMIQSNCKQNFLSQFGVAPDGMVNSCVNSNLRQLYVIPAIANQVGLEVSREFVEEAALRRAQENFRLQRAGRTNEDDILSVSEIYQRELSYYPFDLQMKSATIDRVQEVLGQDFAASAEEMALKSDQDRVRLRLRIIAFGNSELEEKAEKSLKITEEQIKQAYEEEQKKLTPDKQKPFDSEREFVKSRLQKDHLASAVAATKKQLGNLKAGFSLSEVEAITGFEARNAGNVALKELNQVKSGNTSIDLLQKDILLFLGKGKTGTAGPFSHKEKTIFLELQGVEGLRKPEKIPEIKVASQDNARTFLNYVVDREAEKGKFTVYAPPR